jgi:hypothetical protein
MKRIIIFALFVQLMPGCCFFRRDSYEPPRPQSVMGWKYQEVRGVSIIGEFVLKKGESTSNGEIQIKLVEVLPAEQCADQGEARAKRRARIQFITSSDQKVVCDQIFPTGGGNLCGSALDEFWISGIGIRDISVKDQWVYFILTGAEKEK